MKVEKDKTIGKVLKILCQNCKIETNHLVLTAIDTSGREDWDGDFFAWESIYQIIQCQGCEDISFRIESSNSEDYHPVYGQEISETIYPRRMKETINAKTYLNLPYNINRLYKETIDCYNNDVMVLSGAGVRALVEGICIDNKIIDGEVEFTDSAGIIKKQRRNNLQGKINGLFEKGILTKENTNILHEHRYLGNEAVHELSPPSKEELTLAINIIEHILDSIYEIPKKAFELRNARKKSKT